MREVTPWGRWDPRRNDLIRQAGAHILEEVNCASRGLKEEIKNCFRRVFCLLLCCPFPSSITMEKWGMGSCPAVCESAKNLACSHLTHPLKRSSQSQPLQRSCSMVCLGILKTGSFCEHWIFGWNRGRQQLLRLEDAGWYAQVPIPAYSLLLQSGEFSLHTLLNWGEINKQNVPSANSEGKMPSNFTDRSKITVAQHFTLERHLWRRWFARTQFECKQERREKW